MKAERLLRLYEKIADAPDAVARLRRFVLDLAVRGKLVPQDPNDEPAATLLKRIEKEKARLASIGEIRKPKSFSLDGDSIAPFPLPMGWKWVRLGQTIDLLSGQHLQPPEYAEDSAAGLPYITGPSDFGPGGLKISRFALIRKAVAKKGQLLLTVKGSGVGKATICDVEEVAISRQLMSLTPIGWERGFLVLVTSQLAETLQERARSLIPGISRDDVEEFVFGLPPLAEQRRIVAKVDELMALCDRLEAARRMRETKRDAFTAATLARLNAPDPETFADDARFALNALPALTARADQIKTLRQTILNLAVRGKLVQQDNKDEPAAELARKIMQEKAKLFRAGEIRKEKPLPPIKEQDRSFVIPHGWTWARLGELARLVTSGSRDWAQHYADDGAIFVRMGNLSKGHYRLRLDQIQRVRPPHDGEGTRTRLEGGDILISITGDVGMLGLIPDGFGEAYINQHTAMVRPMPAMRGRFLAELFRSPFAQDQFNAPQRGIKNSFRLTDVNEFVVPLPPLAEQHRIVKKVDELMALCDRLEANLTANEATRAKLLESLLAEALTPAARELEAAQ